MSSGEVYLITEEEAKELMIGNKKGLVGINSIQGVINMSFVSSIIPEDKIDNSKKNEMQLHDGTYAVKKYGIWCDANNPDVRIDPHCYPEIIKKEEEKVLSEEDKKRIEENSTINLDNIKYV